MINYNLFVYGSLREGFYNYKKYLKGRVIKNSPAILKGMDLYHLPYKGYPAIIQGTGEAVGEIIEVSNYDETVKAIDDMENFISEGNPENEYEKKLLEVYNLETKSTELCFVYYYNKDKDKIFTTDAVYIPEGNWKEYMNNKK